MRYYIIDYSANATEPEWYKYDYKVNREMNQNSLRFDSLPNYNPIFAPVILNLIKKKTDVLLRSSISGAGFTFNEKVKNILLEHNLINARFYPLKVLQFVKGPTRGVEVGNPPKYFHMQIVTCDFWNWIDYDKSEFYINDDIKKLKYYVEFNNSDEIKERQRNFVPIPMVTFEKLYFRKLSFNNEFWKLEVDMFYMNELHSYTPHKIFISERLKDRLEQERVTGLDEFIELNIVSG